MLDAASKPGASQILHAIADDMRVWMEGKNQTGAEDIIHIADPLATYLAFILKKSMKFFLLNFK